jgi:eukaryotic-like serine/threonine-protein kinase
VTDVLGRLTTALADRYRIERELGAGGMATVYLAHDVRHDRQVALKVLRPELASILGAERFLSEIKTTAHLQHPHILPLHDSGEAEGLVFYVMPYVEGESLRDRLTRERQLPVEGAIRIASEVAGALDYAHRRGVVHRDIKPENILLHEGQALVADFGIALAASRTGGGTRLTETGMSLGTPHYMAPEQAMGEKEITPRADIYALGCVLYEMLSGEPPFTGPSAQAIIARVMTEEPRSLTLQRHTIPANIEAAVRTALEKLPADRFASAAEFAQALKDPHFSAGETGAAAPAGGAGAARAWWRDWRAWNVAAALVLGVALGRLLPTAQAPPAAVERFDVAVPAQQGFVGAPVNSLALSPDGGMLVYVGHASGGAGYQLYVRRLGQRAAFQPIPGTESGAYPAFSPDGAQLAYMTPDGPRVLRVPFAGAATATVAASVQTLGGLAWLGNAALVMTDLRGGLARVTLDGRATTFVRPDTTAGEHNLFPQASLADRRTVLAVASRSNNTVGPLIAVDSRTGRRTPVLETAVNAAWYAEGCLLWTLPSGALQAAPFDPRSLRLTGEPVTLAEGVRQAVGGSGQVAVSEAGSLVYLPEQPFNLDLVDAAGHREVVAQGRRFHSPRFSPDGSRLATDFLQQGNRDVWTLDLRQRTLSRLTFENDGHDPVWSRDGRWVYYVHDAGIWRQRADGGGAADSVYTGNDAQALELTRDGAIIGASGSGPFDIVLLSAATPHTATPLVATPYDEQAATLSPDGRWLAYSSDETGRPEIYVRPLAGGGKVLVSQGGGSEPRWSPDGRALYYRGLKDGAAYLFAARVAAGGDFAVSRLAPLFDVSDFDTAEPHANWDVSPDGKHFAMVDVGAMTDMVFVLNWPLEVERGQQRRAP